MEFNFVGCLFGMSFDAFLVAELYVFVEFGHLFQHHHAVGEDFVLEFLESVLWRPFTRFWFWFLLFLFLGFWFKCWGTNLSEADLRRFFFCNWRAFLAFGLSLWSLNRFLFRSNLRFSFSLDFFFNWPPEPIQFLLWWWLYWLIFFTLFIFLICLFRLHLLISSFLFSSHLHLAICFRSPHSLIYFSHINSLSHLFALELH